MIDTKNIEQARNADIISYLEKYSGFTFAHRGGEYRCRQHPSLAVKNDRRSFYWHSKGIGGYGVIDYLTKVEGMAFREAVEVVTGTTPTTAPTQSDFRTAQQDKPKILKLPERKGIPLRLYDYLCNKRGIDSDIVTTLMNRDKLYEDVRGNVVFVGYDEYLKPRFASIRGTHGDFRGDCAGSDKRYSFSISGFSERLYVFESALDAMSHASIVKAETGAWERDSRLSLSGTSDTAMPFFLNQHTAVKELVFSLDNDHAGREATAKMIKKFADMGYLTRTEPPSAKDYSEELHVFRTQIQALKRTKPTHKDVDI